MRDPDSNLRNTPPRWQDQRPARGLPEDLARWLFDPGSLTRRLRQCCPNQFRVRVLWQGWSRPDRDEAGILRLRQDALAWTREVQLLCGDQAWVFARTLIPAVTLRGRARRLTRLGSRPLGEVLFTDRKVRRGPMQIARIVAGQCLHRRAFAGFGKIPEAVWGRRSLFRMDGRPLLVCELFLPDLPASPPLTHRMAFHHEH